MVQTRAQERSAAQGSKPIETTRKPKQISKSKTASEKKKVEEQKVQEEKVEEQKVQEEQMKDITTEETNGKKHKLEEEKKEEQKPEETKETEKEEEPPSKISKTSQSEFEEVEYEGENETVKLDESTVSKIHKVIEEFGKLPLEDMGVAEPLQASPETILAMVIDAMLKSTRISHTLAQKAVKGLIDAGYNDIKKLSESTWEDRVKILDEKGYARYDERTSSNLGVLVDFVNEKYDGDLNNLYQKADQQPAQVRLLIKEIKGLGDLGVDIFFNNVQSVWRTLAPFIDTRSLRTANEIGIGTDVDAIYEALKYDPVQMSRLANGLSTVRLEHKQGEVSEEE